MYSGAPGSGVVNYFKFTIGSKVNDDCLSDSKSSANFILIFIVTQSLSCVETRIMIHSETAKYEST
jgi:hypothetical protein